MIPTNWSCRCGHPPYRKLRHAFTLIELLVVIAIIALLAAILFPVFARARENARRANCQSNMKQIGLAMIQYTQDFDEKITHWGQDQNGHSPGIDGVYNTKVTAGYLWTDKVAPYLKNTQVFRCPSMRAQPSSVAARNFVNAPSYTLPGEPSSTKWTIYTYFGCPLSVITDPSRTYLAAEVVEDSRDALKKGNGTYYLKWDTATPTPGTPTPYTYDYMFDYDRHLDASNVLFVDGHVKSIQPNNHKNYIWFFETSM
jgi:prepilin-type N-terminal cleavage/methylation domain-containing protein/prepilin-type processing-associated H-X9-DG protein